MHGRKNFVAWNEIHDVMETMGDGNGIYISGTGKENHIYQNYIHHLDGDGVASGIRCDNDQYETIVDGNVLYKIRSAQTGISMTEANHIINNIIVDLIPSRRPITKPNIVHGYISIPNPTWPIEGARIMRNIVWSPRADYWPIVEHRSLATGAGDRLKDTKTDYNLFWCPADPQWGQRHIDEQRRYGVELHSLSADPMFVDVERGDLRLRPESPARVAGYSDLGHFHGRVVRRASVSSRSAMIRATWVGEAESSMSIQALIRAVEACELRYSSGGWRTINPDIYRINLFLLKEKKKVARPNPCSTLFERAAADRTACRRGRFGPWFPRRPAHPKLDFGTSLPDDMRPPTVILGGSTVSRLRLIARLLSALVAIASTLLMIPAPFARSAPGPDGVPKADTTSRPLPHREQLAPGVHAAGFSDRHCSANCGWVAMGEETLLIDLPRGIPVPEFLDLVASYHRKGCPDTRVDTRWGRGHLPDPVDVSTGNHPRLDIARNTGRTP